MDLFPPKRRLWVWLTVALAVPVSVAIVIVVVSFALEAFERVEGHYADIPAARRDGALERGWLPDGVPATLTDIHEALDLDTGETCGCARFTERDTESVRDWLRGATNVQSESGTGIATGIDVPIRMCHGLPPCTQLTRTVAIAASASGHGATWAVTRREEDGHVLRVAVNWTDRQLLFVRTGQ